MNQHTNRIHVTYYERILFVFTVLRRKLMLPQPSFVRCKCVYETCFVASLLDFEIKAVNSNHNICIRIFLLFKVYL